MATIADLKQRIDDLRRKEYCVETNSGTYGASESLRARGTGDTSRSEWSIYETVGGKRRTVGTISGAPGYTRYLNRDAIVADRERLVKLEEEYDALAKDAKRGTW